MSNYRELTVSLSGLNKAKETWPGQYCPSFFVFRLAAREQGPPTWWALIGNIMVLFIQKTTLKLMAQQQQQAECVVCGNAAFDLLDGLYFCSECGTQSQVLSNFYTNDRSLILYSIIRA